MCSTPRADRRRRGRRGDLGGGEVDRLLRRAALAVDRRRRRLVGQARLEPRVAADVERLLAVLLHAARDARRRPAPASIPARAISSSSRPPSRSFGWTSRNTPFSGWPRPIGRPDGLDDHHLASEHGRNLPNNRLEAAQAGLVGCVRDERLDRVGPDGAADARAEGDRRARVRPGREVRRPPLRRSRGIARPVGRACRRRPDGARAAGGARRRGRPARAVPRLRDGSRPGVSRLPSSSSRPRSPARSSPGTGPRRSERRGCRESPPASGRFCFAFTEPGAGSKCAPPAHDRRAGGRAGAGASAARRRTSRRSSRPSG